MDEKLSQDEFITAKEQYSYIVQSIRDAAKEALEDVQEHTIKELKCFWSEEREEDAEEKILIFKMVKYERCTRQN
jgi:hypothetical protein